MTFVLVALLGSLDPACTKELICQDGYTQTVRPPASYTTRLKKQQMAALGLPGDPSQYEEDHFLALEACGHPTDPRNLWPQPWADARKKDVVETAIHRCICKHGMSLKKGQDLIRQWPDTYIKIKAKISCTAL